MQNTKLKTILKISLILSSNLLSFEAPHFYKSRLFQGEPRFEKFGLITIDTQFSGGKTKHEYNNNGDKIYLNIIDTQSRNRPNIYGKFSYFEALFNLYFNINHGLFLQGYMPVRKITLSNLNNREINFWDQADINNINITQDLAITPERTIKFVDIADFSTLIGWSKNYQETTTLDFIDFQIITGIIWPTGTKDYNNILEITSGYGLLGVPVSLDLTMGIFDWLTLGTYGQAIIFKSKNKLIKNNNINKLINLYSEPIYSTGAYIKADHIIRGLSLIFGYAFDIKVNTKFNKNWDMHTLQFLIDYDFNEHSKKIGSRISLFYNKIIAGKNIYATPAFGGSLGVDFCYNF